jgi:hypothetical protein
VLDEQIPKRSKNSKGQDSMPESSDHKENNTGAAIEPHRCPYLSAKADGFGAAESEFD